MTQPPFRNAAHPTIYIILNYEIKQGKPYYHMKYVKTVVIVKEDSSIDVTVDRTSINEGESIILTVTAKNINGDPEVIFPNIFDFKISNISLIVNKF